MGSWTNSRVSGAPCSCPCFGSFWQRASYQEPTHFSTHMILLFLDVTCTANIDDCIQLAAELWPDGSRLPKHASSSKPPLWSSHYMDGLPGLDVPNSMRPFVGGDSEKITIFLKHIYFLKYENWKFILKFRFF